MNWWDPFYNVGAGLARDIPAAVNWFGQQASKSPEEAQADVRGAAYDVGHSLATIPQRAFGASETMRTEGTYNPAPIVDAAMLPMGGPAAKSGEMVLSAGARKTPVPLIGGYHGTGSPVDYAQFKAPPLEHDLWVHGVVDPSVANQYSYVKAPPGTVDKVSGEIFGAPGVPEARTIPTVMDARSALRIPFDAGKWNEAGNVIEPLAKKIAGGFEAPRGILSDLENISGSNKTWREQLTPMLKEKGYDSILYPHHTNYGDKKYNTFGLFDAEQMTPRWSPGGRVLEAERGVYEPMKSAEAPWRLPKGILKPIEEAEPAAVGKEFVDRQGKIWQENYEKNLANAKAKEMAKFGKGMPGAAEVELMNDFKAGNLTNAELFQKHQELYGYKTPREGAYFSTGPWMGTHFTNEAVAQSKLLGQQASPYATTKYGSKMFSDAPVSIPPEPSKVSGLGSGMPSWSVASAQKGLSSDPQPMLSKEWLANLKKDLKAGLITDAEFNQSLATVPISQIDKDVAHAALAKKLENDLKTMSTQNIFTEHHNKIKAKYGK
jgi:hypothetical protein